MPRVKPQRLVYFMKPVGMDGPIKIGCSHLPSDRLMALTIWSPFPLEIIGSVPGSMNDERFLHRCFAHSHSHGEWFQPTTSLLVAMRMILKEGMSFARDNLVEVGEIRQHFRSDETKARMSASLRASWAMRKERDANQFAARTGEAPAVPSSRRKCVAAGAQSSQVTP